MATLFPVRGIVTRLVTEAVDLRVHASSESEALAKAQEVLERFPRPHRVEGVPYCYVAGRHVERAELSDLYIDYPGEDRSA